MPVVPRLYDFQREGVAQMLAQNPVRTMLCDDTGLGKTPQILRVMLSLPKARPRLVICPPSLRINWQREAYKFAGFSSQLLLGNRPVIAPGSLRTSDLLITGYDTLFTKSEAGGWLKTLQSLGVQFVAADEGQNLCSMTSKRSIGFRALCQRVPNIVIATATPLVNRPSELWPLVSTLWPEEFDSVFSFMTRYCEGSKEMGRWKWTGAKNLKTLNALLRRLGLIRRLKADVLSQLPAKRRYVVPMPLSDQSEYDRAERDFKGWLVTWAGSKAKSAMMAADLARFGYMKRLTAELKLPAVMNWLDNWLSGSSEKILVFAIHRQSRPYVLQKLYDRYKSVSIAIDGSKSQNERQRLIDEFQSSKQVRAAFIQYQSGGAGLNLQAAQTVVHVELGWNHVIHKQATGRADRIGQTKAVDEYFLVADCPIEEKLCQLIEKKQKIADRAIDGVLETADSLNIFTELAQALLAQDSKG